MEPVLGTIDPVVFLLMELCPFFAAIKFWPDLKWNGKVKNRAVSGQTHIVGFSSDDEWIRHVFMAQFIYGCGEQALLRWRGCGGSVCAYRIASTWLTGCRPIIVTWILIFLQLRWPQSMREREPEKKSPTTAFNSNKKRIRRHRRDQYSLRRYSLTFCSFDFYHFIKRSAARASVSSNSNDRTWIWEQLNDDLKKRGSWWVVYAYFKWLIYARNHAEKRINILCLCACVDCSNAYFVLLAANAPYDEW